MQLAPVRAFALRIDAERRTKAQFQPADAGILDTEDGGVSGGENRRNGCKSLHTAGAFHAGRGQTNRVRYECERLRMFGKIRKRKMDRPILGIDLATGVIRIHCGWGAGLCHAVAAGMLPRRLHRLQTSRCWNRDPQDRHRQHQPSALSATAHLHSVNPKLYLSTWSLGWGIAVTSITSPQCSQESTDEHRINFVERKGPFLLVEIALTFMETNAFVNADRLFVTDTGLVFVKLTEAGSCN